MSYEARDPARLDRVSRCSSCSSGSLRVLSGDMSIGELAAFNALVLLANGPIISMLGIWDEFQYSSVLLNRLNDIVTEEPEQGRDRDKLTAVPSLEGRIRIENLGFRYSGRSRRRSWRG